MQQGSTPPQRRKSSLNREIQTKIGKQLEVTYNEFVNQGVPDRFVDLIRRLEGEGVAGGEGVADVSDDKGS